MQYLAANPLRQPTVPCRTLGDQGQKQHRSAKDDKF